MNSSDFLFSVCYHTFERIDQVRMILKSCQSSQESEISTYVLTSSAKDVYEAHVALNASEGISFYFEVWRNDNMIDTEPRFCHFVPSTDKDSTVVKCNWIPNEDDNNYRYSSAFRQCIYPFDNITSMDGSTLLLIQDYLCPKDTELYVTGNLPALGSWSPGKALKVSRISNYSYAVILPEGVSESFEYKFFLKNSADDSVIWEDGDNRVYDPSVLPSPMLYEQSTLRLSQRHDKLAGVVVPVFSLRSEKSWGVGDFGDLRQMVDWAHHVDIHILQTLPVNDTTRTGTWEDSYPYNSISIYALHPMYANLNALGELRDKALQEKFEKERKVLNELPQVDYERVNHLKNSFLHSYFEEHESEISVSYGIMKPYCCFRVLQDEYGTADFHQWPQFQQYDEKAIDAWMKRGKRMRRLKYYGWVQSLLISQLSEVHDFARSKAVILKGDMPIGVSRDSATAWFTPRYFHLDGQAGAPPDFFSAKGQNWGFPTYNWENILADNGLWWKQRLQFMARFYDAYRIDHVLGFFRIWQIPYGTSDGRLGYFLPDLPMTEDEIRRNGFWTDMNRCCQAPEGKEDWDILFVRDSKIPTLFHPAVSGQSTSQYRELSESERQAYDHIHYEYFYRRHNDFWANEGMRRLPCAVYSTEMLVCAEDLGMIPDCVHGVLERFRILSLEVQSMPKRQEGQFSWLPNNPFRSVDTITTHDMEPLRLWWHKYHDNAQAYFEQRMCGYGEAPRELSPEMAGTILDYHLKCPSLLCVIALQDWLAMDADLRNPDVEIEQINQPANPRHYWRYRMHITIEKLMGAALFNNKVKEMSLRK